MNSLSRFFVKFNINSKINIVLSPVSINIKNLRTLSLSRIIRKEKQELDTNTIDNPIINKIIIKDINKMKFDNNKIDRHLQGNDNDNKFAATKRDRSPPVRWNLDANGNSKPREPKKKIDKFVDKSETLSYRSRSPSPVQSIPNIVIFDEKKISERRKDIKSNRNIKHQNQQQFDEPIKQKKPKHLKRKLDIAIKSDDKELLFLVEKESLELASLKADNSAKWLKLCKKLVLDRFKVWDQNQFDLLLKSGCSKKQFLDSLGVKETKEIKQH
jgi:hypothetical protein